MAAEMQLTSIYLNLPCVLACILGDSLLFVFIFLASWY